MNIQQTVGSKALTVLSLSMIMLLSNVSLAEDAYRFAMLPAASGHDNSQGYCSRMRQERQRQINSSSEFVLKTPLWQSGEARCFIPAENLYYVSLVLAQKELDKPGLWYDDIKKTLREKAALACQIMGYDEEGIAGMSSKECVHERFQELIKLYKYEYQEEIEAFISERNHQGEYIVNQCVTAFYQSLPSLSQRIQFPLAYYDMKIESYPVWYLKDGLDNSDRLEGMRETLASDVVKDALSEQCPGEMIYWLYLPDA